MRKNKTWEITLTNNSRLVTNEPIENTVVYTTDTEAYLNFRVIDSGFEFDSATIAMLNKDDGSIVERPMTKEVETAVYEIESDVIPHFGLWQAQVLFKRGEEIFTSRPVKFVIERYMGSEQPPRLEDVVSWKRLYDNATETMHELTQIADTNETIQLAEAQRVLAESERSEWFDTAKPEVEESIIKSAEALTKSQNALNVAFGIDGKATNALNLSKSADTLSKQVQSELNQIVSDGESSAEVTQARIDASGETNETLKARLDKEHTEVTTQLAQTLVNPEFETESSESVDLGLELIDSVSIFGDHSGWTISGNSYTHTSGNTQPLTLELPITSGLYRIDLDISKPDMSDRNGVSDYYIQLGGSAKFETYRGVVSSQVWGIRSGNSNTHLVLTPDTDFEGTLTLSVRRIEGTVKPHSSWLDSNKDNVIELRHTKKGSESIYIGKESGQYSMQGDIEQNASLGHQALKDNTSGFWNSAIGARALEQNTVGSRNIAIGRVALSDNISGDRNIGVGTFSLRRNTTGRSNIAVGADSLWYNTTGNFNIGLGLLALADNPDGENNIAIGQSTMAGSSGGQHNFAGGFLALNYNEGNHNISFGMRSMYRNISGSHNVASGYHALFFNETGDENVAIGRESMENTVEGTRNTSIGRRSLRNLENGIENTAVGNNSLTNITNGENNTAIGRNTGIGLQSGKNNVYVGNTAGSINHESDNNILIGFNAQKKYASGDNELNIGNVIRSQDMTEGVIELLKLRLTDLPTTEPSQSGTVWSDNGTLKIV